MTSPFVHLHVHTEYSLVDGTVSIAPLIEAAINAGMPAVAITDQCNMFAVIKFYREALSQGIKPIVGVDFKVWNPLDPVLPNRLLLLCQNKNGYRNLTQLVSRCYLEGQQRGEPLLNMEWLTGMTDGIIALSGGDKGSIGHLLCAGKRQQASQQLLELCHLFPGRFYLELHRTGKSRENEYIEGAVELAYQNSVPVVATNNVRFLSATDFDAHEARVCINQGRVLSDPRRPHEYNEHQYLKSGEEMAILFADIPEALRNAGEIARRCNLTIELGKNYLPDFPVPAEDTLPLYFSRLARQGLTKRLTTHQVAAFTTEDYEKRLKMELETIINMGFPGYFLIVADFIQWARNKDIPVGPGRGSGAGSLVAYSLGITDLDPLAYDLLFERFLNPERVSLPDFDIDFCMDRRDEVIDYVANRYGRDKVAQIITYGTMAAKAAVRDVGRVLAFPYGFVDQIAKLIPFELGITLDKALSQEEVLRQRYEKEDDVKTIIDLAKSLEGLVRNAGKHAGGLVIAPSLLTDFTPLYCEHNSTSIVTQLDKDDVEAVGLVKFDFLGLRTLTIIHWAVQHINQGLAAQGQSPITIETIPTNDAKTFELLKACATTAVFQLESRGMKDLIHRLQPDCFDEIIALVALFRPGPLQSGMVDDFINRKHGRAKVDYPHEKLEPILKATYGVILYQEQVMQIAQVLAGYTLGGADLLRRAMGKKKAEEMAQQRAVFINGAVAQGVDANLAKYIFDLMEKFAGYGFNKSHSAAYALIAYQTAWLKTHYTAEFMAAVLSADMDNTDKIVTLIDECRNLKIKLIPPDINVCQYYFTAQNSQTIVYGLGAIKGVGKNAIDGIIQARQDQRKFQDLFDFCSRIDLKKLNRRTLDALIKSGALDNLGPNRATLLNSLSHALQFAEQDLSSRLAGQADLFAATPINQQIKHEYLLVDEVTMEEKLKWEKETIGLYLTGHPIDGFESELKYMVSARIANLKPSRDQAIVVAGLIVAMRTLAARNGGKMAFITVDDKSGRLEIAVFPEVFQQHRDLLLKDAMIVVQGQVTVDEYSGGFRMSAEKIEDIEHARESHALGLAIIFQENNAQNGMVTHLADILRPFSKGKCPVTIHYRTKNACARIKLGQEWQVFPANELLLRLRKLAGPAAVQVEYQ